MTEAEWMTCQDVLTLLAEPAVSSGQQKRRLRLFSVACCRQLSPFITSARKNPTSPERQGRGPVAGAPGLCEPLACRGNIVNQRLWKCLEASERYADGNLKDSGLDHWTAEANKSWIAVEKSRKRTRNRAAVVRAHHAIAYTCLSDRYEAYGRAAGIILGAGKDFGAPFVEEMRSLFPHLLRDIFGNPFRPVRFDPAWRTAAAVGVARAMYTDRNFDGMVVLADASEAVG